VAQPCYAEYVGNTHRFMEGRALGESGFEQGSPGPLAVIWSRLAVSIKWIVKAKVSYDDRRRKIPVTVTTGKQQDTGSRAAVGFALTVVASCLFFFASLYSFSVELHRSVVILIFRTWLMCIFGIVGLLVHLAEYFYMSHAVTSRALANVSLHWLPFSVAAS